jgi:hypothetical protein
MFRRFALTGLPALLRLMLGQTNRIETGVGALISASFAVFYEGIFVSPYCNRDDQLSMMPTQQMILVSGLDSTGSSMYQRFLLVPCQLTIICGMLSDIGGENPVTDIVVTVIIFSTCVPVLMFLVLRLIHPRGIHRALQALRLWMHRDTTKRVGKALRVRQKELGLHEHGVRNLEEAVTELIRDGRIFNTHSLHRVNDAIKALERTNGLVGVDEAVVALCEATGKAWTSMKQVEGLRLRDSGWFDEAADNAIGNPVRASTGGTGGAKDGNGAKKAVERQEEARGGDEKEWGADEGAFSVDNPMVSSTGGIGGDLDDELVQPEANSGTNKEVGWQKKGKQGKEGEKGKEGKGNGGKEKGAVTEEGTFSIGNPMLIRSHSPVPRQLSKTKQQQVEAGEGQDACL